MAVLLNPQGTLRFELLLADKETVPSVPGMASALGQGRLLARAGIEHLDAKDGTFWPLIRLTPYWLRLEECEELVGALERLIRGEIQGTAFRSAVTDELGLQIGASPEGTLSVEVGIDLHRYLARYSGKQTTPGTELALFRFGTDRQQLVSFAAELKTELRELEQRGQP